MGIHVKRPPFLSDFNDIEFSPQIFEKYPNIKFHESPCSGSRVVPRGLTDGQAGRHDEANSHFTILRMRLKTNKTKVHCVSALFFCPHKCYLQLNPMLYVELFCILTYC